MALNATLVARQDVRDCLSIFTVRPDSGVIPPFEPGQFIMMGLPSLDPAPANSPRARRAAAAGEPPRIRMSRRSYSIASAGDGSSDTIELYLARIPTGKLTPRLWELQPGDRVHLDDKCQGQFTLAGFDASRDLVLAATGTGLAPYVSMLRSYARREPEARPWRYCNVLHGVRDAADLAYGDELRQFAETCGHVTYQPLVSCGELPRGALRGRIGDRLEWDPARTNVMLCGNPAMIDDLVAPLQARGFKLQTHREPGNLRVERYW